MARKVINKKGFLIIAMTPDEAINKCKFGINISAYNQSILIDDNTNKPLNGEPYVYYVAVLNKLFSKNTIRHWLYDISTIRYDEDIAYEKRYYNYYANILKI